MSDDKRVDVELRCDSCQRETLATDGCWASQCWACGGTKRVVVRHDHRLTYAEAQELGYTIGAVRTPKDVKP